MKSTTYHRHKACLLHRGLILAGVLLAGCASTQSAKLVPSERPLDMAIDGTGYFILNTGHNSYLFTRVGDFSLDANRYLINADGYRLAPSVLIPDGATEIHVSLDGKVVAVLPTGQAEPAGNIRLAVFPKPSAVERDGIYVVPTPSSGDPTTHVPGSGGAGTVRQGMIEK